MNKEITFNDGAIVVDTPFYDKTAYDVGNNRVTAQFDGRGAISKYALINRFSFFDRFTANCSFNGVPLDWGTPKRVVMQGKKQITTFSVPQADVTVTQFVDNGSNCVYCRTEVKAKADVDYLSVIGHEINYTGYVKEFFVKYRPLKICKLLWGVIKGKAPKSVNNVIRCDITSDFYLDIAANCELKGLEKFWRLFIQFSLGGKVRAGETRRFDYCLSCGARKGEPVDVAVKLKQFDEALKEADDYIATLKPPKELSGHDGAFYSSLLNCSLSSYKDLGKFKGFLAGIVYQSPARTYYRDGYWTVLSVLPVRPDLVRNEIHTLARGIDKKTGKCPSAVKYNFKNYWGDHYDSPSFLAIMVYDYVRITGDKTILSEKCPAGTVFDAVRLALKRLELSVDSTGLLVKAGEFNRRDWCDNVFREGYVTYDEALFARAEFAVAKLADMLNLPSADYYSRYEAAVKAINDLLWDEEKGYFVNFKNESFTEDNLSIDTVPIALFSLTTPERARRMLQAMEQKLESINNKEQCAGDFGTLSVWPFYKDIRDSMSKSALPYYYHNGGDWPYWSGMYAYAKLMYGMEYRYPLFRWFDYNLERGNYTPIEFFSPIHPDGSLLQAWSSTGAVAIVYKDGEFFKS